MHDVFFILIPRDLCARHTTSSSIRTQYPKRDGKIGFNDDDWHVSSGEGYTYQKFGHGPVCLRNADLKEGDSFPATKEGRNIYVDKINEKPKCFYYCDKKIDDGAIK